MNRLPWVVLAGALTAVASTGGCALSRADQLAQQAQRVDSHLRRERDQLAASGYTDVPQRIDHLTSLHTQLTVANTARKLAPRLLRDPAQVDAAYDVLEEVYSTIDWNIPLPPGAANARPMPKLFDPAQGLDFNMLQSLPPPARRD